MSCLTRGCFLLAFVLVAAISEAQYKGDHIPGFAGLESGSQAPPGLYVGDIVWVYPTSTVKDNAGDSVHLPGSLTSTAEIILVSVVTNYKLFGAPLYITAEEVNSSSCDSGKILSRGNQNGNSEDRITTKLRLRQRIGALGEAARRGQEVAACDTT